MVDIASLREAQLQLLGILLSSACIPAEKPSQGSALTTDPTTGWPHTRQMQSGRTDV